MTQKIPEDEAYAEAGPIVAVGEILWDLLPAGPRLGGTAANFATGCARLGRSAALVSRLGADAWGERARRTLADTQRDGAELLDTTLIQTDAGVPTGVVQVTVTAEGQPTYVILAPAAWDEICANDEALEAVRQAHAICFGTLCQRAERSRAAIRALVTATGPACVRVLDVNVRAPFFSEEVARWSLRHCTVAKISEEELEQVAAAAGLPGVEAPHGEANVAALERCGRGLLARYPAMALLAITMGARGSLLLSNGEAHHHPGCRVDAVDTVGAGDAFTAGLVHAWLARGSLAQVNEVGNLCGSFVASQPGATPVFPAALLERVAAVLGRGRR